MSTTASNNAKRAFRIAVVVLFAIFLMVMITLFRIQRKEEQTRRLFPSIHTGDSRQQVLSTLGKPDFHDGACGTITTIPGCEHEFVYNGPRMQQHFVILFSHEDRVIYHREIDSP